MTTSAISVDSARATRIGIDVSQAELQGAVSGLIVVVIVVARAMPARRLRPRSVRGSLDIRFEIAGGELAAVRVAVTFAGCCGYEGADSLARRLRHPGTHDCTTCGPAWVDTWGFALDRTAHAKGEHETWTRNRDDRTITAELDYPTKIAIRKRRAV
jgi:hypothetical protein